MFADHPVRKQVYLDWKIRILPSRPMQMFFKGVNPSLWSKIEIIFFASFKKNNEKKNRETISRAYLSLSKQI